MSSQNEPVVFLNGDYLPRPEAKVDVEDRGWLFGDGVYEVVRYYAGRPFAMREHLDRMAASLEAVRLPADYGVDLAGVCDELVSRNGLTDARVYWQVTRGSSPRNHKIPADCTPTVFAMANPDRPLAESTPLANWKVILHPDQRWALCRVKSILLLPNSLAKTAAADAGADEAVLHRDGEVTEGTSTNVFIVRDGVLWTHPATDRILHGITRAAMLKVAVGLGITCREEVFTTEAFRAADEAFVVGTTTHVASVTSVDGDPIGSGEPGPLTRQLYAGLVSHILARTSA